MTQEELDALMAEDLGDAEEAIGESVAPEEEEEESLSPSAEDYRVSAKGAWPPPPPTNDHKVVHQLDEVTAESEEKSSQIFDVLEELSNFAMDLEKKSVAIKEELETVNEVFRKLHTHFPSIATFERELSRTEDLIGRMDEMTESAQSANDQTMVAMDIMQYQDIHRQKIERVINVMRALSGYMNSLFEGKIADEKRVSSAVHIQGDTSTEDVVDEGDIEALIAAFGSKK